MRAGGIVQRWIVPLVTVNASYLFCAWLFDLPHQMVVGTVCGLIGGFVVARTNK